MFVSQFIHRLLPTPYIFPSLSISPIYLFPNQPQLLSFTTTISVFLPQIYPSSVKKLVYQNKQKFIWKCNNAFFQKLKQKVYCLIQNNFRVGFSYRLMFGNRLKFDNDISNVMLSQNSHKFCNKYVSLHILA